MLDGTDVTLHPKLLKADHEITIVYKANTFFTGSSGKNQNRLHVGCEFNAARLVLETVTYCTRVYILFF